MKTITDQLANYASYHRDRRNIVTHFIGIPMIVVAIAILLARPSFEIAGITMAPIWLLAIASVAYYLVLDLRFGVVMGVLMALAVWAGMTVAAMSTGAWLGWGIGLFVIGWIAQFIGHFYEGRKPAFVDDLVGLLIGPLFVVAEAAFGVGLCKSLQREIDRRVGPVHGGHKGSPVSH
ncbi:Uncharacterized membrane protein YGL010W [Marinobacter daqiaonensis]|uniref:Uncharacterized membrane protein YGL010W n=1 Tax=Marinobacter daqiaonensis TaxID=650891 RepID=A0A1I6ICC1_9GAMM|nr:Mpo1-like protein [Marinobacter daqiaonensis]SFR64264.1 Uncharacterized membrane protein YGL010W [Marinobacter daqiaonensis]